MIINEAIYAVLDGANISSDDFPVRKRFVYNELKVARAELIKQELNKNSLLDSVSLQTIECIEFERTNLSTCDDIQSDIYVLRSKIELPALIEYKGGVAFFMYTMDGGIINPIDKLTIPLRERKRFKLPGFFGYYILNKRIIIANYDDVDELNCTVDGHFKDPEDIYLINKDSDCEEACLPVYKLPFVCPSLIERRVIEIARTVVFKKLQIPLDNSNNSQFDPNVKSQP